MWKYNKMMATLLLLLVSVACNSNPDSNQSDTIIEQSTKTTPSEEETADVTSETVVESSEEETVVESTTETEEAKYYKLSLKGVENTHLLKANLINQVGKTYEQAETIIDQLKVRPVLLFSCLNEADKNRLETLFDDIDVLTGVEENHLTCEENVLPAPIVVDDEHYFLSLRSFDSSKRKNFYLALQRLGKTSEESLNILDRLTQGRAVYLYTCLTAADKDVVTELLQNVGAEVRSSVHDQVCGVETISE